MPPGLKTLRRIQLGQEVTAGTPVAATAIWRGMGTIEDTRETVFPEEDVGFASGVDRSYVPKVEGMLEMEPVEATFEQLPYILTAGVEDLTTGVADGAGSDFIYTYDFSEATQNAIQTFTLEGGDDQGAEEFNYCFVQNFTLSGASFESWMMSATWIGREVAPSTFTGAISLPAIEEILFAKTKLFIDAIGGTFGATQISNTLIGAELVVDTGYRPIPVGDGNLFYSGHAMKVRPDVVLNITFEHDASAIAEKVNWRAETPQLIQLLAEGSAFGTAGTTYSNHSMIVNLAGRWEDFEKIGAQDGNDIIRGVFRSKYNATAAEFGQIIVVNEVTALP
jgi:hypothetical protein